MTGERRFDAGLLAALVNHTAEDAAAICARLPSPVLVYSVPDADEQDRIAARIEDDIETRDMRVSGENDPTVWERGWQEVADALARDTISYDALRPQYFHDDAPPCRLFGEFIVPGSRDFEYWVGLHLRAAVLNRHVAGYGHVVEYGCGTGINLFLLASLFPKMRLTGLDWAGASARILEAMAAQTGADISGGRFNMLTAEADTDVPFGGESAVVTIHAMEQLYTRWRPFIDYIRARRPGICVHIEPVFELYDADHPLDALARRFHRKRHYLEGFLPALRDMEQDGEVDILECRRIPFGGQYHEAHSVIAWRPAGG